MHGGRRRIADFVPTDQDTPGDASMAVGSTVSPSARSNSSPAQQVLEGEHRFAHAGRDRVERPMASDERKPSGANQLACEVCCQALDLGGIGLPRRGATAARRRRNDRSNAGHRCPKATVQHRSSPRRSEPTQRSSGRLVPAHGQPAAEREHDHRDHGGEGGPRGAIYEQAHQTHVPERNGPAGAAGGSCPRLALAGAAGIGRG